MSAISLLISYYLTIEMLSRRDPSDAFKKDLKMLVKSFTEVDRGLVINSIPQDPQLGQFYFPPKLLKLNNWGRPIALNKLTRTEKFSQNVKFYLKLYAQSVNSFIQETTDIFEKLL